MDTGIVLSIKKIENLKFLGMEVSTAWNFNLDWDQYEMKWDEDNLKVARPKPWYKYNCRDLSHGCTRVENPGGGEILEVFAKIPRGVKGFRKNCQGGSTYFVFYCIFINKFFKNLPGGGGGCFIPLPPYPPCVHLCYDLSRLLRLLRFFENIKHGRLSRLKL